MTTSMIGIELADGTVKAIFCYSDGYPHGVGDVLARSYTSRMEAEKLIALGNLSSIGDEIGKAHGDARPEGQCHAYGRDMHRDGEESETFESIADLAAKRSSIDCLYVFTRYDRWTVTIYEEWYDLRMVCGARVS